MKEPSPFHMIRIRFHPRDLFQLMRRPVFSKLPADTGYLIHSALKELFGELAPSPFEIMATKNGMIEVLAYADLSHSELLDSIRERAPDALQKAIRSGAVSSRPMPLQFPRGEFYRYRVRLCPVIRKSRGSGSKAGSEMDVFLAEVERSRQEEGLDRREVYRKWFEDTVTRKQCVDLQTTRITELKLDKLLRRNQTREPQGILRPNAVFEGLWSINDPDAFRGLIRKGIGRHKSFGFGMVLLKRAER